MPTRTNGFVGIAEGHHRTARLKMPTSALANKSLAETHKTKHSLTHLYSPVKETVDDGCSCLNQRVGVSWRVFPEYAA